MKLLFWPTIGTGSLDLVLLHGWGLNARVWSCIISRLAPYCKLHLVDLPGYGRSRNYHYGMLTLTQLAEELIGQAPANAIWLGWSLGGLVANMVACQQPEKVKGLITVASSPYFCAEGYWPGINNQKLNNFAEQLHKNVLSTIYHFLALQTMGVKSARKDMRWLKTIFCADQYPSIEWLAWGLKLLKTSDLRLALWQLDLPLLRLYGYFDELVPRKVISVVDQLCPTSRKVILLDAAHIPFLSSPDSFCKVLRDFISSFK